jgi:histidinol dehydrogenase
MEIIKNPDHKTWTKLSERPVIQYEELYAVVRKILNTVKADGDAALIEFTAQFDRVNLEHISVDPAEIKKAAQRLDSHLIKAIRIAKNNIETFHRSQIEPEKIIETFNGVQCWRKSIPIDKVGLYIPGGSAPLFSSLLMLGVPAKIAGCKQIVVCTPPNQAGKIEDVILYTADVIGITDLFCVGGAQAIAAMTYGSQSVPKVDKIFGPGNQYVTAAKQMATLEGVAIDMPAGPSEVLVIADASAQPEFVAADLLSQAEHGPDSQVILLSDSESILTETLKAIESQIALLPRKEIAQESLTHAKILLFDSLELAMNFSNLYAPEHLIIATENANMLSEKVEAAGSVFIGHYSCESAGDYASGTNHTLPTNGYARNYSGVSLDSFFNKITFQEISSKGIEQLGPTIETLAKMENLQAHARAVEVRRNFLKRNSKK